MKLSPFWLWAILPTTVSASIVCCLAIPNFREAGVMRADSKHVSKATDEYLVQRDDFEHLQVEVETLRIRRDNNGHSIRTDSNDSKLISTMTRPIDGKEVLDQSIRIGEREMMSVRPAGLALDRRNVEMQMTGSFDAIFNTVRKAEEEAGLSRIRSIDIHREGLQVQVIVGIDEYFHAVEGKQE
ncbi:MAG: hypothetical protein O2875_01005 [Planctomycetota bacterium]|nr:hypothetical protein [Planctomycetota bacterium]MDA1261498.1 hypothetical protein [Planctomycetota bacterium]